jgi:hypothetical protein
MPISSKSGKRYRRLAVERLERREVLSADFGFGAAAHVAPQTTQHFDFAITGTEVYYSPLGLPTEMKGTCYLASPNGASLGTIGTYDETLQPIFAPVGPGGSPAFVGATGVCTFDFDLTLGNGHTVTVGSIVADDTALIDGVLPDGSILVVSVNSPIVSSTGICAGLSGTFDGQSEVVMGATFFMHTDVEFAVTSDHRVNMEAVLTFLASTNHAGVDSQVTEHHHLAQRRDDLVDSHAAVDAAFASTSDDFFDSALGI